MKIRPLRLSIGSFRAPGRSIDPDEFFNGLAFLVLGCLAILAFIAIRRYMIRRLAKKCRSSEPKSKDILDLFAKDLKRISIHLNSMSPQSINDLFCSGSKELALRALNKAFKVHHSKAPTFKVTHCELLKYSLNNSAEIFCEIDTFSKSGVSHLVFQLLWGKDKFLISEVKLLRFPGIFMRLV